MGLFSVIVIEEDKACDNKKIGVLVWNRNKE